MNVGACGHLFCSAPQFKTSNELSKSEMQDVGKEEHVMQGEEERVHEKTLFELGAEVCKMSELH